MIDFLIPVFILGFLALIIWFLLISRKNSKNKLPLSPIDKEYEHSIDAIFDELFKRYK